MKVHRVYDFRGIDASAKLYYARDDGVAQKTQAQVAERARKENFRVGDDAVVRASWLRDLAL